MITYVDTLSMDVDLEQILALFVKRKSHRSCVTKLSYGYDDVDVCCCSVCSLKYSALFLLVQNPPGNLCARELSYLYNLISN